MTAIWIFVIVITLNLKHSLFPENLLMGRDAAEFLVSTLLSLIPLNLTDQ